MPAVRVPKAPSTKPTTQGGTGKWKKGQSGNKAGKPPGAKALWNRITNEQRKEIAEQTGGLLPVDLFVSVCRQEDAPLEMRLAAAAQAAPYLHRKMPMAIEGGDPSRPITLLEMSQLKGLPLAELKILLAILEKAGTPLMDEAASGE